MNVRTEEHRIIDIRLPGSTTLRVALVPGEGNDPGHLVLAHGFGGGAEPFQRPEWCGPPVRIPATSLGDLREALAKLEEVTP